jgi:hypothetical protein
MSSVVASLVYKCRAKNDDDASIPLIFLENNEIYIKANR